MVEGLDLEPNVRVVELGPGTGSVTGEIARRLPQASTCLAIDVNPDFSARVGMRWPAIASICDRAERLVDIARERRLLPIDHIVSGLPFASLPGDTARAIVDAIVSSLRPGGTFTTFQYVHAYGFRSAVDVRRTLTRRMGAAPTRQLVVGNLPPALVLRWTKAASLQRDIA
jgi:phospholipid N-methyltransferase